MPPATVTTPLTLPPWVGLGMSPPGSPADVKPGSETAIPSAPPLPELQPYMLARDRRDHHPPAEHHNNTTVVLLLTALPDPSSVWEKVKLAAIMSGDYEGAELIQVPMLDGWEPEEETPGAYPGVRGNGTSSDKYTHFQWPALSELRQLVAKHGLGSTEVANML